MRGRVCERSRCKADRESAASRWAYYRDFGRSRLLVIDSRAARVLTEGHREMIDPEEWQWIEEHTRGSFDHLIIASTLPVFMAHGIHHLESWNEAVCDGVWGTWLSRLGGTTAARRRPRALARLSRFLRTTGRPASQHQSPVAAAKPRPRSSCSGAMFTRPTSPRSHSETEAGSSRIFQIVCSPFRNPLHAGAATRHPLDELASRRLRLREARPTLQSLPVLGPLVSRRGSDVRELDRRARARCRDPHG